MASWPRVSVLAVVVLLAAAPALCLREGMEERVSGVETDAEKPTVLAETERKEEKEEEEELADGGASALVEQLAEAAGKKSEDARHRSSSTGTCDASGDVEDCADELLPKAKKAVGDAITIVNMVKTSDAARQLVNTWFNIDANGEEMVVQKVLDTLQSIDGVLDNVCFVGGDDPKICKGQTTGFVHEQKRMGDCYGRKRTHQIHLCEYFLSVEEKKKIKAITHEASHHGPAYTQDLKYGYESCKKLAADKPADTLRNADSYAHFIGGR